MEQLRSLVDAIASETKLVAQQNQRLQDQLHLSGAQMEELKRNLDSVRQESITDSLTGLFNRRKFDETLQEAASRSVQTGSPLCLLMTDIDHFKKFNDNYGHTIGDHVLALVARTVKECIRSSDTPVRYGGEEFAVILPNVRISDAVRVAEQIRTAVASKRVVNRSKNITLGTITLSVGVARYVPGEPLGDLIKRADAGLYTAKRTGRNRVVAEEAGNSLRLSWSLVRCWAAAQQRYRAQDGLRFLEAPRLLIAPSRPVGAGLTGRGARSFGSFGLLVASIAASAASSAIWRRISGSRVAKAREAKSMPIWERVCWTCRKALETSVHSSEVTPLKRSRTSARIPMA